MKRAKRMKLGLRRLLSRAVVVGPLAFLVVAGAGCPSLFKSEIQRAPRIRQAVVGRDGARTISNSGAEVNAYAALTGSDVVGNDVVAGATTITVADLTTLNSNFSAALAQGDLLLIIQMAGATIGTADTVTSNVSDYGVFSNLGNAGHYEFVGVESVNTTSNQITVACGLKNAYSVAGKTQVVRVPQFTTLTIDSGASIIAPAWNGATGGIVALHAETTLELDGQIDVTGLGFRGGTAATDKTTDAAGSGIVTYRSATSSDGADKGESIAGFGTEYTNGRYGRGAPANGGGGGDSHNAGGGGGANAASGTGAAWTGQGVMLSSVLGAAAWSLDPDYQNNPAGVNTATNSVGGGRGGYSYSDANLSPLSVAPGDTTWLGDDRREVGGLGGHPLTSSPTTRLFFGGGGGAGDGNDAVAGPGGAGGGLVFVIAGTVSGAGSILANGHAGGNAVATSNGDAAGGGGGGGTVVVHAASLSAITIAADGGAGGNQVGSSSDVETEGPGGGGGGGYIAVSGGTPKFSVKGGVGGTTDRPPFINTFPSNGATAGNAGVADGSAASFLYCATTTAPVTTIVNSPSNPTTSTIGVFTFQTTESGVGDTAVTYACKIDTGDFQSCDASFTTPVLTVGTHTLTVQSTDLSGNTSDQVSTTWVIESFLDGGVDDGGSLDSGSSADAADDGVPPILLDAGESDADALSSPDATSDAATDAASSTTADAGPVLNPDAVLDSQALDGLPLVIVDGGVSNDAASLVLDSAGSDARADGISDATETALAEPGAEPSPRAEPASDAAIVANADAASNKDAASSADDLHVLGSGFCAIAQTRSSSPAPFALLALAGLALLRRRRR